MMAIISFGHAQAFAQVMAERMANSLGQGLAIAALGWIFLRALRRHSASTRFALGFASLLTVAALPWFESADSSVALTAKNSASAFHLSSNWAMGFFLVWAGIAALGLAKIALGFLRLRSLRSSCQVIDPKSLPAVRQATLAQFASIRHVTLLTSEQIRVPAAIGFLRPAILLPAWALTDLDPAEMNAVLLHELAHLRRWDDWTNLAQQVLRALFFFQPAVWWIGRSLAMEREMACDDLALAAASDPAAYARCLVSVAEKSFLRRGLALALAMAGRVHQTAQRVARILEADRPDSTPVGRPALAVAATFAILCVVSLPHVPRLVDFDASSSYVSAAASGSSSFHSASQFAGGKVVSASFHPPASFAAPPVRRKNMPATTGAIRSLPQDPPQAREVKANYFASHASGPKLLNASGRAAAEPSPQPRSVFLVMQTEQMDDLGQVTWSISIYHLTVYRSQPHVRQEITPKTT
jgi:beta-lactamase regulating signal transducer with metallopeptidase domain